MANIIKIDSLNCEHILKNISLNLEAKKMYSLLGEIGSGKTTLLKCIAGLKKHSGTIINSIDNDIAIYLDEFSFIFKDVLSNLIFPLKNIGYSENTAKDKICECLKQFDLYELIHKSISDLTYREKKIIKFIETISTESRLILLDNIFDGLNNKDKETVLSILNKMKKSTILFTTRDANIAFISDQVIIIHEGKIVLEGKTKEVLKDIPSLLKYKINIPFSIELSNKLKSYNLIDNETFDINEIIGELWK